MASEATNGDPFETNNGSHGNNSYNGSGPPGVGLYTVSICTTSMVAFGMLGTLSNLALLLSTKCKRSIRSLQYGLPYCLAVANLILCLLWVPMEVTQLILNFANQGLYKVICYAEVVLFYFCVGMIVFLNVFISIHRLLTFLEVTLVQSIYAIVGILLSLGLSGFLASTVVFEYAHTWDFAVCTQSWQGLPGGTRTHLATTLATLVWVISLTAMSILISIVLVKQRKTLRPKPVGLANRKIRSPRPIKKSSSRKSHRTQDSFTDQDPEDSRLTDREPSSCNRDGSSCKVQFSEPSSSKEKMEKSSSKNLSITEISKQFFFGRDCRSRVEKNDDNDSDLDDDEYEQKMKLKLQKSLSGRRHTVANIGLGESLFGRSKQDAFGNRSTSPNPHGYQYVRKWSVDIQALQDQLENPKAGGTNTFSDLQLNRKKQTSDNRLADFKIVEEKHEEEKEEKDDKVEKEVKEELVKDQVEEEEEKEKEQKLEQKINEMPDENLDDYDDSHVSQELLPVISDDNESSVANGNNTNNKPGSHSTLSREVDFRDKIEIVEEEDELVFGIPQNHEQANNSAEEEQQVKEQPKTELIREMQVTTVCLLLTLIVLVCVLPFAIMQLSQVLMPVSINRDLSTISAAIVLVQTPIHTFMIAWMERKIWQALRKLHIKLTHWKCVCYCNIGKDRQCLGRPHYNGKSNSA